MGIKVRIVVPIPPASTISVRHAAHLPPVAEPLCGILNHGSATHAVRVSSSQGPHSSGHGVESLALGDGFLDVALAGPEGLAGGSSSAIGAFLLLENNEGEVTASSGDFIKRPFDVLYFAVLLEVTTEIFF